MNDQAKWRSRALRVMEKYFQSRGFPRLTLGLILIVTGLAGFGLSYLLLRAGMGAMGVRYPLAVLGAYGFFLLLMRVWVELERHRFNPDDPAIREALDRDEGATPVLQKRSSWLDWLDLPGGDLLTLDEGCLPALLVGVVVGLVALVVAAVFGAPALLAEVFVDAFLVGVLYRRLKIAAREHWLGTAIRKTWGFVLGTAVLLGVAGLCLEILAPGAKTIGAALEHIRAPKN